MKVPFNDLEKADLIVDCVYESGPGNNLSAEPLRKLLPKCGTSGGFRKVNRTDGSNKPAYVVLYTSMRELEWPDFLDKETGIFRYYGDNRKPGRELTDTKLRGNLLLEQVFDALNSRCQFEDIPPFLIFKNTGNKYDVEFLGIAAPGNPKISPDKDLVAFWRTVKDKRFQNYEAYFTILNTGSKPISKKWLEALINDHDNSLKYAPDVWRNFIRDGRNGIVPLKAPKFKTFIPDKYEQLQSDNEGMACIKYIYNHYHQFPQGFEACAKDIIEKMDNNFVDFSLTRPWRDGGRDAIGHYQILPGGRANTPLKIDCALEAKCYNLNNSVGVKEMSRLISRIRYRQFGILVTTSYVGKQAYEEVVEDGHPILIVTASDIAGVLRKNAIDTSNIGEWLDSIESPWFDSTPII